MTDNINHPPHYTNSNSKCSKCDHNIECIDITRHLNFNLGNAIKYIWRAEHKGNKIEDLKKAIWYLEDEINKIQEEVKTITTRENTVSIKKAVCNKDFKVLTEPLTEYEIIKRFRDKSYNIP